MVKSKGLILAAICCVITLFLQPASAAFDLSTIDMEILNVQIEPSEASSQTGPRLIKIELNFQNNGDSSYFVKAAGNVVLIFTKPYSSSKDLMIDTKKLILENYEPTTNQKLRISYEEFPELGKDCDPMRLTLQPQQSKTKLVCFEIPPDAFSSISKQIENDQYFFRLDAASISSTCPNCKIISLKDAVGPTIKEEPSVQSKPQLEDTKLPEWIKNNAGWWSNGQISDSDFLTGIQYLIDQGIMIVPKTETTQEVAIPSLPSWIKQTAGWWAKSQVTDDDFLNGIKYLVEHGIIRV